MPVAAACGDQQAALVGNGGFTPGDAKATFGTGIFVLMLHGRAAAASRTASR